MSCSQGYILEWGWKWISIFFCVKRWKVLWEKLNHGDWVSGIGEFVMLNRVVKGTLHWENDVWAEACRRCTGAVSWQSGRSKALKVGAGCPCLCYCRRPEEQAWANEAELEKMGQKSGGEGAGPSRVFSAILRSLAFTLTEEKNLSRDVGRGMTWCDLLVKRFTVAVVLKIHVHEQDPQQGGWLEGSGSILESKWWPKWWGMTFSIYVLKVEPKEFPERLGYAVAEGGLEDEPQMFSLNDWKDEIASCWDEKRKTREDQEVSSIWVRGTSSWILCTEWRVRLKTLGRHQHVDNWAMRPGEFTYLGVWIKRTINHKEPWRSVHFN